MDGGRDPVRPEAVLQPVRRPLLGGEAIEGAEGREGVGRGDPGRRDGAGEDGRGALPHALQPEVRIPNLYSRLRDTMYTLEMIEYGHILANFLLKF